MARLIGAAILLALALGAIYFSRSPEPSMVSETGTKLISVGGTPVYAEIASTEEDQMRGLGGRESLGENQGMLFVFPKDDFWGIWMKDMRISIDILWLDQEGIVIDLVERASPDSYPQSFRPSAPSRYVLELPEGFSERYGVIKGTKVAF